MGAFLGSFLGYGESRKTLDDFQLSDGSPARVDSASISAIWAKEFPQFTLSDKDLEKLVPREPITEDNKEQFDPFMATYLHLGLKKTDMQNWLKEDHLGFAKGEGWYESTGVPLVTKVFNDYDENGDGVLDKEESAIFFYDFAVEVSRVGPLPEVTDAAIQVLASGNNLTFDQAKNLKHTILRQKKEGNEKREHGLQAYKASKEEKDKAVLAIMDANGDGKLQLQEVLDSFRTGSDLRKKVLTTWGLHASELGDAQ